MGAFVKRIGVNTPASISQKLTPLHTTMHEVRPSWIRGVNLGGWLVLERYITPYQFAVTDCHLRGEFCWYPGQASAPPKHHADYQLCDLKQCHPFMMGTVDGQDYPMDEYTLGQAFPKEETAEQWLNYHFEHFITFEDIQDLKDAGVTHLRVPLPHWILGNKHKGEPWVVGDRWKYFQRLCAWSRQLGLQVWPDIHTAPGSQNGFDNSGQTLKDASCEGWSAHPENVQRSLQVIREITEQIVADGLDDVVTGFGLLNEPFLDCDREVYESFLEEGLDIARSTMGPKVSIYASDMFSSDSFNNGHWWLDPTRYANTFLDSHFYQVFAEHPRALSPRQHIAYTCQNEHRDLIGCCYEPHRQQISRGVSRIVGEWSVAVDSLPVAVLRVIMDSIAANGTAAFLDRELSSDRQDFLKHFAQAQIVSYEAAGAGISAGWFYWTAKMEGGAFAEWDFLRAFHEGWLPKIAKDPFTPSEELYGSCYDIIFKTNDSMAVIHEFPDPSTIDPDGWEPIIDDDVVVSHGESLLQVHSEWIQPQPRGPVLFRWYVLLAVILVGFIVRHFFRCGLRRGKSNYTEVPTTEITC